MSIWSSTTSVEWVVPGARRTSKTPILKLLSTICWKASTATQFAFGFNVSEGWVRDVSEEVAQKLRQRCADENRELPYSLHEFIEQAAKS
jgi:hypothetical protein